MNTAKIAETPRVKSTRQIVLASGSPRRKELLEKIGLELAVETSDFPETSVESSDPRELAEAISREKARAVAPKYPDAVIIAADTFGVLRGKIIGKPGSPEEARKMLQSLSGRSHQVITGFTVLDTRSGATVSRSVETRVYFRKLSDSEIENYVKSGEPLDKAGAYAIQGLGSILVEKIDGDFYNVMGLPLSAVVQALKQFGIHIL